jgi:hypothetical protein
LANQWIATDSALNPFVQNFFARLPWHFLRFLFLENKNRAMIDDGLIWKGPRVAASGRESMTLRSLRHRA